VLADKDIIHHDKDNVTFRYIDSTTKKTDTHTLPTLKFLLLILRHVLPKGLQRERLWVVILRCTKNTAIDTAFTHRIHSYFTAEHYANKDQSNTGLSVL